MNAPRATLDPKTDAASLIAAGRRAIEIEGRALAALLPRLDASFARACTLCLACTGRVIVTGMGKSGHIGSKIAATLASTGTPSFFMHAAEASHGDIGMITREDLLLAISNSGETAEVLMLIPHASRLGVPLIAVTGNPRSSLARAASVHLDVTVEEEACPLNLAPTASTTVTLALGDALAVALLEARGFTSQDFARSHPGGALGRKLLLHVADVMRTGDDLPVVSPEARLAEGLVTFGLVFAALAALDIPALQAGLAAAIAMASSPAVLLVAVNDDKAQGQVTERALNLVALNTLVASIVVTILLATVHYEVRADLWNAVFHPLYLFAGSIELIRDVGSKFAVAVFADAGNAFNSFDDPLMYSVGAGLRLRLPVVSVGLDVAQALTTPAGSTEPR